MPEQNDHDLLIRVDQKLEQVIVDIKDLKDDTKEQIHENTVEISSVKKRLDTLENWRWYQIGISTAIIFAIEVYTHLHH